MGWNRLALWLGLAGVVAGTLGGCDDGGSDGGGEGIPVERHDAGDSGPRFDLDAGDGDSDDEDAGIGPIVACTEVPRLNGPGAIAEGLTSTTAPTDFDVTRVSIGFECATPALVITLSGGNCPGGNEHALTLRFSTDAIAAGTLPKGQTRIDEQRSGIEIRYTRKGAAAPGGTWGNCGTGDLGTLDFAGPPALEQGAIVEGSYNLLLHDCEDSGKADMAIFGYYKAEVEQSFDDACH